MSLDDELKELADKYHLPLEAGEDLAMRNIALHLWGEFHFHEDERLPNGDWFRRLYFSQKEQRWYKKHHAPAGLIVDEEKSILDYEPKRVAEFMARAAAKDYASEHAKDTLRGLTKVIDWLVTLQTELTEKLR